MNRNSSTLVIQDDNYSGSLHLDELLLDAIPHAQKGAAAFAFATADGLSAIFDSEEFARYCANGHHFDLYLGIDSITDLRALERAKELIDKHDGRLNVRVYYDSTNKGIFHPKTTWFENNEGDGCIAFVGSGNLTHAGLQRNVEIFSWIEQDSESFKQTYNSWNGWIEAASASGKIHAIDDNVVEERARENGARFKATRNSGVTKALATLDDDALGSDEKSVVISVMPSQRSRGWGQFAMAKEYYSDYFGFDLEGDQSKTGRRVLLKPVYEDGSFGPMVSARGNISQSSHNYRLELAAARRVHVNQGDRPVVVFAKTDDRTYLYQVFGSDSKWSSALVELARSSNNKLKGKENPKCRISMRRLIEAIPDLPVARAAGALDD